MDETNALFARNELFTVVHVPARDAGIQQVFEAEGEKIFQPRKLYNHKEIIM
jgi:hypothetical protein